MSGAPVGARRRGETPPAIAAALGLDAETVRRRIRRFNAEGLAALEDHHRSGRPATYSADAVAAVIAAALTSPRDLELPCASWTLDRLAADLLEHGGIAMRRSRIDEILLAEGSRWRRQETWFGARVDPEFAEKRGGSRRSTPCRPPEGSLVVCLDEMGPLSAKSHPGREVIRAPATAGGPGPPRDRLRPARQGLHLRRLLSGQRCGAHAPVSGPRPRTLGGVPGTGRGLGAG